MILVWTEDLSINTALVEEWAIAEVGDDAVVVARYFSGREKRLWAGDHDHAVEVLVEINTALSAERHGTVVEHFNFNVIRASRPIPATKPRGSRK